MPTVTNTISSVALYNGQYIFPPRTKMTSPFYQGQTLVKSGKENGPTMITKLWLGMKNDVTAQYKLNGNRNLIKVFPDRTIEFWNRHQERQKYVIPTEMRDEILRISPEGVWTVWDSELMNFKTKNIKDMVYLYDVLVWRNEWQVGKTYGERYNTLEQQVGKIYLPLDSAAITGTLYLAHNLKPEEWANAWDITWSIPWIEGLVAKRLGPVSRLEKGTSEYNNSGFMCRFRMPNKHFQ